MSLRARWAVILIAVGVLIAWNTDWRHIYDAYRGATYPDSSRTYEWHEDDLDNEARTAAFTVPNSDHTLEFDWAAPLTITHIRLEVYEDAFGTGFRLGVAADSTTEGGPNCLNARVTGDGETTTADWCIRSDQHRPIDMAEFLGKESDDDDQWAPDSLYITQTANLDPAAFNSATQVDYFGFGLDTGNSFESGLWGPHPGSIQGAALHDGQCPNPGLVAQLDDIHLSDRYTDPAEHQGHIEYTRDRESAYPEEHRLYSAACHPANREMMLDASAFDPFQDHRPIPLSTVFRYNASYSEPQPLRTVLVVDVRSCDATLERCTSDDPKYDHGFNEGTGRNWMAALLDT